ncbi:MAG: TmcC family electron transfer complex membrane anchor subunit [Thermodesulfobacteriota bacterium]
MNTFYSIISGPLAWTAWTVFILGMLYRILSLVITSIDKDPIVTNYFSLKYALRSIMHWSIPFASRNMRLHPAMTIISFAFHICLVVVPLFTLGHIILWEEYFGFQFPALPSKISSSMTGIVVCAVIFFALRRIILPEVRYVTGISDFILLILIFLPFISGMAAYHQWFSPKPTMIIHILSSEILLISIPFTRMAHMFLAVFTRSYTGSEFGSVRHAKDW